MLAKEYLYKFIQQTESLYSGLSNYVGKEKDDKIILVNSRALSDYLKKSQNDYSPKFTSNDAQYYINRIKFLIFQDKRDMENSDETIKDKIDSPEDFSAKCVDLFFRISGINFIFLRLSPDNEEISFIKSRQLQQTCLYLLFEVTIDYLMYKIEEEKKNSKHSKERNTEDIHSLLSSLWSMLFKAFRYILLIKEQLSFQNIEFFFTNTELYDCLRLVKGDYYNMRKKYLELGYWNKNSNYIVNISSTPPAPPPFLFKSNFKTLAKELIDIFKLIKKISKAHNKNIPVIIENSFLSNNVKYTNYKLDSENSVIKFEIINNIINDYYSIYDSFHYFIFYYNDFFDKAEKVYEPIYCYIWEQFISAIEKIEHLDYFLNNSINRIFNDLDRDFWYGHHFSKLEPIEIPPIKIT